MPDVRRIVRPAALRRFQVLAVLPFGIALLLDLFFTFFFCFF